jgi:hypothetical protein
MTSDFSRDVETIVGPVLTELDFVLDEIDDSPDEGGIERHIVYYRSSECKIQIYDFSRQGETNCMIAALDAPNEFGLNSRKWHYITKFSKRSDVPPQERLRLAIAEAKSYANPLDWVRDRIVKNYEAAHAGILEMYGKSK